MTVIKWVIDTVGPVFQTLQWFEKPRRVLAFHLFMLPALGLKIHLNCLIQVQLFHCIFNGAEFFNYGNTTHSPSSLTGMLSSVNWPAPSWQSQIAVYTGHLYTNCPGTVYTVQKWHKSTLAFHSVVLQRNSMAIALFPAPCTPILQHTLCRLHP